MKFSALPHKLLKLFLRDFCIESLGIDLKAQFLQWEVYSSLMYYHTRILCCEWKSKTFAVIVVYFQWPPGSALIYEDLGQDADFFFLFFIYLLKDINKDLWKELAPW